MQHRASSAATTVKHEHMVAARKHCGVSRDDAGVERHQCLRSAAGGRHLHDSFVGTEHERVGRPADSRGAGLQSAHNPRAAVLEVDDLDRRIRDIEVRQ
jgi:hypothetical protein